MLSLRVRVGAFGHGAPYYHRRPTGRTVEFSLVSVHKRMIFRLESIVLGDELGRLGHHFVCCGGCVG